MSTAQLLMSSTALAVSGYLFYNVLTMYGGDGSGSTVKDKVPTVGNYYADDQLTNDIESEITPLGKTIQVKRIDHNLFDVQTGMGSWIRMNDKKLETLIGENNRSLNITFV